MTSRPQPEAWSIEDSMQYHFLDSLMLPLKPFEALSLIDESQVLQLSLELSLLS